MIHRLLCITFACTFAFTAVAQPPQDTVFNQTDKDGLKQGYWKKTYPNGNPVYIGYFVDGKPQGELKRFYEEGEVKAVLKFGDIPATAEAKLFYPNGELAAEGMYKQQQRHGQWKFYSYYDQSLKAIENYEGGIKQGMSVSYYPTGQTAQELKWNNGIKDGAWKQYFDNGIIKLQAIFKNGKLHGDYRVYHSNGKTYVEGQYNNGLMDGPWKYYDEKGELKIEAVYSNGKLIEGEELIEQEKEFFEMIEENEGKFTEPTIEDLMPM